MTTDLEFKQLQVVAGQDLTVESCKFHAVTVGGTIAANAYQAAGVLRHGNVSGNHASVAYEGITKLFAGAAINTVGFPITVTASGWFIAASSGGLSIGRALSTAASGDLVQAMVDFKNLGFWRG